MLISRGNSYRNFHESIRLPHYRITRHVLRIIWIRSGLIRGLIRRPRSFSSVSPFFFLTEHDNWSAIKRKIGSFHSSRSSEGISSWIRTVVLNQRVTSLRLPACYSCKSSVKAIIASAWPLVRPSFPFSAGVPLFRASRLKNLTVREQGDESNREGQRMGG